MTTVTMSKEPTYKIGPSQGIKTFGTTQTEDLHVKDDALIDGNLEVTGTLYCTLLTSGVTITASNEIDADITVLASKDITAAAGDEKFDYALATGTFDTSTGTNTLNGNVAIVANKTFAQSGSGTFATGTGAVGLNGDITVASGKDILSAGGDAKLDFKTATGIFESPTGANGLNGDVTIADGKAFAMTGTGTFGTGTGAVGLNGDITIAKGKHITVGVAGGQGAGKVEFLSTGIFTSPSGANTLMGDVTINGSKTFTTGTGAVTIKGAPTIDANLDLVMGTAGSGTGGIKTGTGAIALNGAVTVATAKTLAVTDADALTVGGVKVPQKVVLTVPINASSVDQWVFVADAAYELLEVQTVYTVTATGACNLDIVKSTSVQAPAAGATMLTGVIDMNTTANTVYSGTKHGTEGNRRLADGNKMGITLSDQTPDGLAGAIVTITMMRV
jgi:hypothetical protein